MEPLPNGRSSPMATVNGGKLWVLGGTSGTRSGLWKLAEAAELGQ